MPRMLSITPEDWQQVQKRGGKVTFRPLRHSRYTCNQIPRLSHLTMTEVKTVRSAVYSLGPPGGQPRHKKASAKAESELLKGRVHGDYADCPHCDYSMYIGINRGRRKCQRCDRPFNAPRS